MMAVKPIKSFLLVFAFLPLFLGAPARADMTDFPVAVLQSLDKTTARTVVFEARVGGTVKFGPLYIKIQACRKAPPIEQPEAAAFLQIWEVTPKEESKWVFSGWMFASSPSLSPMDHPVYDVWVKDCLERKSDEPVPEAKPGEEDDSDAPDDSMPDGEAPKSSNGEPPPEGAPAQ